MWVIDLSLILFNTSWTIYSILKEWKYIDKFLSTINEIQCVPFFFCHRDLWHTLHLLFLKNYFLKKRHKILVCNWNIQKSRYCLKDRVEKIFFIHISSSCSSNSSSTYTFTTKEITGCTNEAAKSAYKAPRNPPLLFFISCFTVSVTSSINTNESANVLWF